MEAATLPAEAPEEQEETDAPVDGAEATRPTAHLFQYSQYVHAGEGSEECEHGRDGKCDDPSHFHAWVCLPNSLQHRDILEKARAARARRKRALKDAGGDGRPSSDAYETLESELDDLLSGDVEAIVTEMAARRARKGMAGRISEVIEDDERFENYYQDAEEWRRLSELAEEERGEEFAALDREMTEFEEAVKLRGDQDLAREKATLASLGPEAFRNVVREARIEGEAAEAHITAYYAWLSFVGTRRVPSAKLADTARYFPSMEAFRRAAPETISVIDETVQDLESRMQRGDAAGN
jgi:hypothetical protein